MQKMGNSHITPIKNAVQNILENFSHILIKYKLLTFVSNTGRDNKNEII